MSVGKCVGVWRERHVGCGEGKGKWGCEEVWG